MHGTFSNTRSGNGTPFSPSREATLYCAADIEAQCEGRQTPMGANLETEASGQEENDGAGDVGGHESIQTRNDRTPKHVAVGQHQAGKSHLDSIPPSQRRRPKEDGIRRIGILKLPANAKPAVVIVSSIFQFLDPASMLNLDQTNIVANMCANYTDKTFQNCVEEWIRRAKESKIRQLRISYSKEFSHGTSKHRKGSIPTPFLCACEKGRIADIEIFMQGFMADRKSPRVRDVLNQKGTGICGYTHTPLQVAAANEQVDAIKVLLANGAEPSVKTRGWNALHFASQNSKKSIKAIEVLLSHMTLKDINYADEHDAETPLDVAYFYNFSPIRDDIVNVIRKYGGTTNAYVETEEVWEVIN